MKTLFWSSLKAYVEDIVLVIVKACVEDIVFSPSLKACVQDIVLVVVKILVVVKSLC